MPKQSFVQGTVILTVSSLITRILGFASGILMARLLGPEGMGLMMMAHPLIPLLITLTEMGLPVAISKLVAEAEAQGNVWKVRRILHVSLAITGTLSVVLTLGSLLGAKLIAAWLLPDPRAYYAMLALTPIAPIIAVSSVLKGYFRGKQNMKPLAYSDIVEHIVRIPLILALIQLLLPMGVEYAVAGAMVCSVLGEGSSLLYLIVQYRRNRERQDMPEAAKPPRAGDRKTLRELLEIGLPTTGQGLILSFYSALQPLLVMKSLELAGVDTAEATKQFGLLTGYAFPLLFFPGFILHSLSTALIPAISEASAGRDVPMVHQRLDQAMRIAFMIGAPGTMILYGWAVPLTTVIFHSPEAGHLLELLAPIFFLQYFETPLGAIMLGLGRVNTAMWNFIASTILKAAAIFVFGSHMGIYGVVLGINAGICLLTFLNFFTISSAVGFFLDMRRLWKTIVGLLTMFVCGKYLFLFLAKTGFPLIWSVLGSIAAALVIYAVTLYCLMESDFSRMFRGKANNRIG